MEQDFFFLGGAWAHHAAALKKGSKPQIKGVSFEVSTDGTYLKWQTGSKKIIYLNISPSL